MFYANFCRRFYVTRVPVSKVFECWLATTGCPSVMCKSQHTARLQHGHTICVYFPVLKLLVSVCTIGMSGCRQDGLSDLELSACITSVWACSFRYVAVLIQYFVWKSPADIHNTKWCIRVVCAYQRAWMIQDIVCHLLLWRSIIFKAFSLWFRYDGTYFWSLFLCAEACEGLASWIAWP